MDDEQLYDIVKMALEVLPSRKFLAVWSDNPNTAKRFASAAQYTDKSNRIHTIQQRGCKVLLVYAEPTMLPFGAVVDEDIHEYYKTFGW